MGIDVVDEGRAVEVIVLMDSTGSLPHMCRTESMHWPKGTRMEHNVSGIKQEDVK